MWQIILVAYVGFCMGKPSEIVFPYASQWHDPTTSPVPWTKGEIIQTKPIDTYPWVSKACPQDFCDPSPVFKILAASPTGTAYDLLGVVYPSDSAQYKLLLESKERKRFCDGNTRVLTKCSFFQEFVIYAGGTEHLQILSIHDPGYDDVYLRMRFATVADSDQTPNSEIETEYDEDNALSTILIVGGLLTAIVLILVLLLAIQKCKRRTIEEQTTSSDPPLQLNDDGSLLWKILNQDVAS